MNFHSHTLLKIMKKIIISGLGLLSAFQLHAGNWSLGAGALIAANPYESMKTNILPIPFISYQGKNVVVYGPVAKLRYPINRANIVGLRLQLGMQKFDPDDASNTSMKLLDKRDRLFFVGPYHRLRTPYGQLTTSFGYDVSDNSNGGMLVNMQYNYPFRMNSKRIFLRPGVGLTWLNNKLNKHYYQITNAESTRSGLSAYQPSSGVTPYASLFAGIKLTDKLFWTNVARLNYLPKTIYQSPMVNGKKVTYSLITGITYEIGDEKQRFNH